MLVVTRKVNEGIEVNGPATFKVLEIRGNHCRIGIEAPDATDIVRTELLNDKEDEPVDTEQLCATAHFDCPKPVVDHAECD